MGALANGHLTVLFEIMQKDSKTHLRNLLVQL